VVRTTAVASLGRIGGPAAHAALLRVLTRDAAVGVRVAVVWCVSLLFLSEDEVKILELASEDPDPAVREATKERRGEIASAVRWMEDLWTYGT
jgi:hypothetical protein